MGLTLAKLIEGKVVTSNGAFTFKELVERLTSAQTNKIDLATLGLPSGTYTITVKAVANGVVSERSNSVTYYY